MPQKNGTKNTKQTHSLTDSQLLIEESKETKIELLERKVENIEKYLNDSVDEIRKGANKIYNARINEIYGNLDIWVSDSTDKLETLIELTEMIKELLLEKEKIRSKLLTSRAFENYLIDIIKQIDMTIRGFIPDVKERSLLADKIKRDIQAMFD